MTEREKMLAGELYNAGDPELAAMQKRARRLTRLYNATTEEEPERRSELLSELFGDVRGSITVEPPFHCEYGSHVYAGERLFINFNCIILDCAEVRFGSDVMLGPSVQILTAYHPVEAVKRVAGPELAAPMTIGDRVWIGGGVILCLGVTIGSDTTIGAGSVVTRDIPAGVVAVGNPCRVLYKIDG